MVLSKGCPNQNSQPLQSLDHGLECGGNRLNNQYLSSLWSFGEPQAYRSVGLEANLLKRLVDLERFELSTS